MLVFFFFSSRRRHTRLQGDWSSDVCSSDLLNFGLGLQLALPLWRLPRRHPCTGWDRLLLWVFVVFALSFFVRTLWVTPRAASVSASAAGEWLGNSFSWVAPAFSPLVVRLLVCLALP